MWFQTRTQTLLAFFALWLLAACALPAAACPLSPQISPQAAPSSHAKVELISEEDSFRPGHTLWVGLHFELDTGWHIYWQNPGDSGEPPRVAWNVPAGFQAGAIRWPAPKRLGSGSVVDYGYEGQVLLMVPVRIAAWVNAHSPLSMGAAVKYLVCREICIPGKADLTLTIPGASAKLSPRFSEWRKLFDETRAEWPRLAPPGWKLAVKSQGDNFILSVSGARGAQSAEFFPLDANFITNSAQQVFAPSARGFTLSLKKSDLLTKPPQAVRGLIVENAASAYEVSIPVKR